MSMVWGIRTKTHDPVDEVDDYPLQVPYSSSLKILKVNESEKNLKIHIHLYLHLPCTSRVPNAYAFSQSRGNTVLCRSFLCSGSK